MSRSVAAPVILPQIEALSRLISDQIGLDFPKRKWDMLQRVVDELARELQFTGSQPFLEELLDAPLSGERLNLLIDRLTVGETYFLRDKNVFTALRNHILPALIERKGSERRLDLWCAASSTGEEPYSIAMLLDEKAALLENWQLNFSASDINLEVIKKAKQGVYSCWSLRATPYDVSRRYFSEIGENSFLLARHIREMVSFYQLNLAEKEFIMPGLTGRLADIIFCRNVLIYFSAELQAQVIRRLVSLLQPGGWLLVSPSELGVVNNPLLTPVRFPGVIVHQKVDGPKLTVPKGQNQAHKLEKRSSFAIFAGVAPVYAKAHKKNSVSAQERLQRGRFIEKTESSSGFAEDASAAGKAQPLLSDLLPRAEDLFAQEMYREVIALLPEDIDLSLRAGVEYATLMSYKARSLANLGELEEAAVIAELAVAADKVNPFYYYFSAVIARERADFGAALNLYRQALFLDAEFVMAQFSLATMLRQLARKGATRHLLNVVTLLEPLAADAVVPQAEGLSAGRLLEIARSLLASRQ